MTQEPKVSIIVPVYGVEKQLPRCVDSLLAQTYPNLEIILVDDGSKDASGRICDDYAAKDARVKVLHKENGGVSSARNLGLSALTGEYLLFVDGDDALEPETVERTLAVARKGDFDFVSFGYKLYLENADGAVSFLQNDAKEARTLSSHGELLEHFSALAGLGLFDFVTDKLFRVSCLKEASVTFDSYFDMGGEDGVFLLGLLPAIHSFCVLPDCFYQYYRRAGESVTISFREGKFDRYHARAEKLYTFMKGQNCLDTAYLTNLYCVNILWMYDSLFSPTCKLSFREKLHFLRHGFEKDEIYPGFCRDLLAAAKAGSPAGDFSGSSRKVLKHLLAKRYLCAKLLFALTTIKNGGFCRA